jgi:hypothetical protein
VLLLAGFLPAVGLPSAAGRPGSALAVVPAAPVVGALCAQAITDTPAKNAPNTEASRTIRPIASSPLSRRSSSTGLQEHDEKRQCVLIFTAAKTESS